jgi:ribosomal protein S18 acetylase RimI-like enzyme
MEINIRLAKVVDRAVIVQLIHQLAATIDENSPVTEEYVAQYLSSPASTILLAEIGHQVVGLLSYSFRPDLYHAADTCLIEELIVREDVRSQGVGSKLVAELLSRLGSIPCAEVSVSTMPDNKGAIKFYRRHGFTDEAIYLEHHFDPSR